MVKEWAGEIFKLILDYGIAFNDRKASSVSNMMWSKIFVKPGYYYIENPAELSN